MTEETKAKIKLSWTQERRQRYSLMIKGVIKSGNHNLKIFKKGRTSCFKGKKRPDNSGAKHPMWKGGVTPLVRLLRGSPEIKNWKWQVFNRDKSRCVQCNSRNKPEAHHIKAFSDILTDNNITTMEQALACKELWDINNGQTLCHECHILTDNWGARIFKKAA